MWAEQTYPTPRGRGHDSTYPILVAGAGRANLPYLFLVCASELTLHFMVRAQPNLPYLFFKLTLHFSQLTLSFFARVSPLVQAHGGGAGAPDLGGLVFARGVCGVSGRRPDQRRGEEVRGVNLPYPFCPNLPYLFSMRGVNLPYTYPIFFCELTLAFFHVRSELTLSFSACAERTYPILFSKLTLAFSTCAEWTYPIFLRPWQRVTLSWYVADRVTLDFVPVW